MLSVVDVMMQTGLGWIDVMLLLHVVLRQCQQQHQFI